MQKKALLVIQQSLVSESFQVTANRELNSIIIKHLGLWAWGEAKAHNIIPHVHIAVTGSQ